MQHKNIDLEHLNRNQIAEFLCVTVKTIDNWTALEKDALPYHNPTDGSNSYYDWKECFKWIQERKEKEVKNSKGFKPERELTEAKLVGENLRNEKEQLQLEVLKGNLLEKSDIEKTWSDFLVIIRQTLLNVGHMASVDITEGMSYAKKKDAIDSRIFEALENVITQIQQEAEALENVEG